MPAIPRTQGGHQSDTKVIPKTYVILGEGIQMDLMLGMEPWVLTRPDIGTF
jgi:hypothetical protein